MPGLTGRRLEISFQEPGRQMVGNCRQDWSSSAETGRHVARPLAYAEVMQMPTVN